MYINVHLWCAKATLEHYLGSRCIAGLSLFDHGVHYVLDVVGADGVPHRGAQHLLLGAVAWRATASRQWRVAFLELATRVKGCGMVNRLSSNCGFFTALHYHM